MIPTEFQSSKYPKEFDSNQNLFLVHDSLKVVLAEDYNPATSNKIKINGDISLFPENGIITLTDQCNEINNRAISFFYKTKTDSTFEGLTVLDGFDNTIIRSKNITYVTQNVMSEHHNSLKNALIAIEEFVGVKGTIDTAPFGETMEGRINFLRKLVLTPRAWFTADKRIGLVPLEVTFTNESFRLGDGDVVITWDMGDAEDSISNLSTISVSTVIPISATDVRVVDTDGKTITKTYTKPNFYDVTLTVENQYGKDSITFEKFINARIKAPLEAIIEFAENTGQIVTAGIPTGGPYTTNPKIRSKTNRFIEISIPTGINPTTLQTYAGEEVIGSTPIDPIDSYTWQLSDDLTHANQNSAKAAYSIGGLYDLVLRCDTKYGSFRISTYESAIDIVEDKNLWLFTTTDTTRPNEFGLISETFKTSTTPYTILRDSTFLDGTNNSEQAIKEFNRNTAFSINGTTNSGNHGLALIAYAGGGDNSSTLSDQVVRFVDFEGFGETLTDNPFTLSRPWNWIFFTFDDLSYFLLGPDVDANLSENATTTWKDTVNLGGTLTSTRINLNDPDNFINGASEILNNVTIGYDISEEPLNGRFSVYRTTQKDRTGYILRNDSVGTFFKLRDFYRTEGTSSDPVVNIKKLSDMTGSVKTEGELVGLSNGIFFFNNSGNVAAYNTVDGSWQIGNSVSPFKNFQDKGIEGYDDTSNSLMATSDKDHVAYISYDYSPNAFIKYNSVDLTFSGLTKRPDGEQFIMGIY